MYLKWSRWSHKHASERCFDKCRYVTQRTTTVEYCPEHFYKKLSSLCTSSEGISEKNCRKSLSITYPREKDRYSSMDKQRSRARMFEYFFCWKAVPSNTINKVEGRTVDFGRFEWSSNRGVNILVCQSMLFLHSSVNERTDGREAAKPLLTFLFNFKCMEPQQWDLLSIFFRCS